MAQSAWEYTILQMQSGRSTHLSERINQLCAEGFEPVMITGDATITILMRKPAEEKPAPSGQ
jgi:hypothetical protein